ncbi:hypothetical protein ACF0H5_008768 [Mactra antiquata]
MGDMSTIKDVLNQSQTGMQSHGKLMKTLHKIYDKTEFTAFWSEFSHYIKYPMVVFKREPAVERVIDFVANFVTSLCKKADKGDDDDNTNDDDEEEDSVADNKLLQEMFDFLLDSHSAKDRGVRFRCCQLINKLLTNLGEEAQIDDDLYDRLYECMLERLKDRCPCVRYHAVMAMNRLQDPTDENCPVIKAFLFLLNCDPNPDVRRAVLNAIAPSSKTLSSIIDRTRDVKESVQQACSGKMLQAWMRALNGNVLRLLKSLDVEDSTDVCTNVLETLFKSSTVSEVIEKFDLLNEQLLIPEENLNSESALYWQVVCKYIHDMGTDGFEYMDKVMPTVVDFCAFMQKYVDGLKTVDDPEVQLCKEFVIEQLLLITSYMDTADAASKKALETLLHNMLIADHVSQRLVKSLITRICDVRGSKSNLVAYFAEAVSEIREPITVVEKDVEIEQKRQINLKIAGIRVKLNQCREDLEASVKDQDFEKAAELKAAIAQLDAEKNELLATTEPVKEEVRSERNDPVTLLKCLTIISEMLQVHKVNGVSPTFQMMIESQILPGIQNEDAHVRNMAMQALGLCCYISKDLLTTYIPLFMQASQIDVEIVRVTALKVLFDLLMLYGLEIIDASESSSTDASDDQDDNDTNMSTVTDSTGKENDTSAGVASKLVAIIRSFLDVESSELRTFAAEGLCKLMLTGRVISSKILSHLILLWYNPLSEDDTHLRDCLGTFFPLYALASRSNQEIVEEAFLPCLQLLLNAPASSPLAEVDVNNVAELLVQLTNSKLLTSNRNESEPSMDNPGHDNLSETVCNEILSQPDSPHLKLWVRILNQMEVSPDNEVVLKDLRILAYKMVKIVKEKTCLRSLQKFQEKINTLAAKFISENDDIENMIIEQPAEEETVAEETMQDSTLNTPKRKRIRGLYSQNMTLGLDAEAELELASDTMVDVDASCLMSRTSIEPPRRPRSKSNNADVIIENIESEVCENASSTEKQTGSKEIEISNEDDKVQEDTVTVNDNQSEVSSDKDDDGDDSRAKADTSDKRGRPTEKKVPTPKKKDEQSEVQGNNKKAASNSPTKDGEIRKTSKSPSTSPAKRVALESPAVKSGEKRKASQSPSTSRKRMSKSPFRSASSARNDSKTSDKKLPSKSPVKERGQSKSPVKQKSQSKSPASSRSPTKSPASSKSPTKSPASSRSPSKSPVKSAERSGSASSMNRRNTSKPPADCSSKKKVANKPSSANTKKTTQKTPPNASKDTVPVKTVGSSLRNVRSGVTKPGSQSLSRIADSRRAPADTLKRMKETAKVTQAAPGKKDTARKDIRTASTRPAEKGATRGSSKSVSSPANAKKGAVDKLAASKAPAKSSPRVALARSSPRVGKVVDQTVADTPDSSIRRSSRSLANTPRSTSTVDSPMTDMSVPETPEDTTATRSTKKVNSVRSGSRTSKRTGGAATPEVVVSSTRTSRLRGTSASVTSTAGKKPTKRVISSSTSSVESSPEKPARKTARSASGKPISSSSSTPGSASSSKSTRTKPASKQASPVKNLSKELTAVSNDNDDDDDSEVESLRRRAKPSRRSATGSNSVVNTSSAAGRSTRSSLSQSSVDSPKVASPSQRTSQRSNKGYTSSSQETLSLISTGSSAKGKSPVPQKKIATSRSQSTSSSLSSKSSKPADSKLTRSAVATRISRTKPDLAQKKPEVRSSSRTGRQTSKSTDRK